MLYFFLSKANPSVNVNADADLAKANANANATVNANEIANANANVNANANMRMPNPVEIPGWILWLARYDESKSEHWYWYYPIFNTIVNVKTSFSRVNNAF